MKTNIKKPKKSKNIGKSLARRATGYGRMNAWSGYGSSNKGLTFTKIAGKLRGGA